MSEVILYHFGAVWDVPDVSPFCVKLETYLRMAEIPFVKKPGNPNQAPKGKLPYIDHEGKRLADSSKIIEYLKASYGIRMDEGLSVLEKAHARAYQSMLEEHLYFVLMHYRWKTPEGWALYRPAIGQVLKAGGAPSFLVPLIVPMIRRSVLKTLHLQGTGRYTSEEIAAMGCSILSSLADFLGDKPYFFGEKATTLDATAYAMLASFLTPIPGSVKDALEKEQRLMAYCARIKEKFYPRSEKIT